MANYLLPRLMGSKLSNLGAVFIFLAPVYLVLHSTDISPRLVGTVFIDLLREAKPFQVGHCLITFTIDFR